MLLDHPLVVLGGDRRQPLRKQVVVGVAPLHLDHLALLAEVFDVMNEQQLDAAALALGKTGAASLKVVGAGVGHFFRGHEIESFDE